MAKQGKEEGTTKAKFNLDDYVQVKERIVEFYDRYPSGRIIPAVIEHDREMGFIMMRAEIYRNDTDSIPASAGHAYELKADGFINKTSYVENCETSAVGRALALLGHKVTHSVASREEMEKVQRMSVESNPELVKKIEEIWKENGGTPEQLDNWVRKNNGGLPLHETSGHRQQAMLTTLEQKKAQSQKQEPVQQEAQTPPEPPSQT